MRSLTSTLTAAQQDPSALPYVQAVFSDHHADVSRLRFVRLYTGSEGDYYSALALAGDGSLVRARIDPATHVLYTQRVIAPDTESDYSSWTSHGSVSASGAVALAASGATVLLFYVDTDTVTIRLKTSSDNGASYGSAATVATAASAAAHLAAAIAPGGDRLLLWSVGATVWKSRYTSGAWGTPAAWSATADSLTGIACRHFLDFNVVVCGADASSQDAKVWTLIYGDGFNQAADTWSTAREVTSASAGSGVSFHAPALDFVQHWRLFFVEKYTGDAAYSRLHWSTMNSAAAFSQDLWREPAAFDYEVEYGIAAASTSSAAWLASPAGVWRADLPSWPALDVSDDIVEAAVEIEEYGGSAVIALDNAPAGHEAAGPYTGYGSGELRAIRPGARLQLAPGYRSTAGAEASTGPAYWVESVETVTGPRPRLVVRARDGWWLLYRWRARHQFAWPAGTKSVSQLIEFICARAGFDYSTFSQSAALTSLKPAFTIHPGESGATAVRRLLAMVPDRLFLSDSFFQVREPRATDAAQYAYGQDHLILEARYRRAGADINRSRVLGDGVIVEAFDFESIADGGERIGQTLDLNLTTSALAADRAGYDLRDAEMHLRRDEISVFGVNCGQELYDVVSVTDPQAGLTNAKRRVLGLAWRYSIGGSGRSPRYEMTLTLGEP